MANPVTDALKGPGLRASLNVLTIASLIGTLFPLSAQSASEPMLKESLGQTLSAGNLKVVGECFDHTEDADSLFSFADHPSPTSGSPKRGLGFIDREQKKALNAAQEADTSPESRFRTLKHFGAMMRGINEFYIHSNYIEVKAAQMESKHGRRFDPYAIELADFVQLLAAPEQTAMLPTAKGDGPVGGSTHGKVARELTIREAARQWEILETLIKNRYQKRAANILTGLKEASCPAKDPDSMD